MAKSAPTPVAALHLRPSSENSWDLRAKPEEPSKTGLRHVRRVDFSPFLTEEFVSA
jgi:hypothetical protein